MDGEAWTKAVAIIGWLVILGLGAYAVRRAPSGTWQRHRSLIIVAIIVLLIPFGLLVGRYGPVSCDSLPAEHGCVCYGFKAADADSEEDRRALYAKADSLCPGHPVYQNGAGRLPQ